MSEDLEARRERWKSSLRKVQDELWIDPPLPQHLYHYSTLDAVQGIVTGRELWLSNIRSVRGDAYDGTYWTKVFRRIINRKSVPNYVKEVFQEDTFGLGSIWHMYLACFSAESELDHQWEHYADQGRGCAIELSFESLATNCDGGKAYAFMPMLYDPTEQEEKAEKTIDAAIMLARGENNLTAAELKDYWISYASFSFLVCGVRFKDPQFSREREWRVFSSKTDLTGVRYRPSQGNQSIAYFALSLIPEMVTGLIKGPACACPDADLIALLNSARYGAKVRTHRSEEPDRPDQNELGLVTASEKSPLN